MIETPYIIESTISEGKIFVLHKARRGTKYVILKTTRIKDAMFTEILRREYEIGLTLSHACIVSTIAFEEETPVGTAIVMEYIDGVTLTHYLSQSSPSKAERKRILSHILNGVEYLHHKGVLHNDIKPDNIIISTFGNARIIDFGLSSSTDSVYKGVIGGSEDYTAPEILSGEGSAGAASDIYSIGLIIKNLFGEKYNKIASKCTRTCPSERYQSISELKRTINLHQNKGVIIFMSALLLIIGALAAWPNIKEAEQAQKENLFHKEVTEELNSAYMQTLTHINKYPYSETTNAFRNFYIQSYMQYYNVISKDKRPVADAIVSEQIAIIDSQISNLPSMSTLPAETQDSLVNIMLNYKVKIVD